MVKIRRITVIGLSFFVFILGVWTAKAMNGQVDSPYMAKVNCLNMSEDSAANLKLTKYEPQANGTLKLVYRCKANGY